jgi:ABC-2 type transport system permease protein
MTGPTDEGRAAAGRRGRRDAAPGPSTVAGHVGALPLVEHAPYRPERTLPVRVELVRQLRRRRTQVAFALVALLPVILWIAFELGDDGPPGGAPNLVDLAKGSGANFACALFRPAVLLGGRGVVLRRHGGRRGVVVEPALPARRADPRARLCAKAIVAGTCLVPRCPVAGRGAAVGTLAYGANDLSPHRSPPFAGGHRDAAGRLYVACTRWPGPWRCCCRCRGAPLGGAVGGGDASIISRLDDPRR